MSKQRFSANQAAKGVQTALLLGAITIFVFFGAHAVTNAGSKGASVSPTALKLITRVVNESYCYRGTEMYSVDLALKLQYANQSADTIILAKNTNGKAEILVAATPTDMAKGIVEYRGMPQIPPSVRDAFTYGSEPDQRFVILKPGERYDAEDTVEIPVTRQGLHAFRDSISPGKHVLVIKYFTWTEGHSLAEQLRARWSRQGQLFSDVITSEPAWFEVAANLETETCGK